jgi:hypothetical protein
MDVNEHVRLFNSTLRHTFKIRVAFNVDDNDVFFVIDQHT